jgi:spermidine/putrescine transport system permease protein
VTTGAEPRAALPARIARRAGEYGGFGPAIVLLGGFFAVPLALIVCYSFWQVVDYDVVRSWTLSNYEYLLRVPTYSRTLVATVAIAGIVTAIDLALAFPVAYWLSRYVSDRWQRPLLALMVIPFLSSYLLRIYSWVTILDSNGFANDLLRALGLTDQPVALLYTRASVVVVLVYLYFPFAVLTLHASLRQFDPAQLVAGMDLGASPARAVWSILLPQIRPGITTAAIFVFVPVLGEYLVPQVIGGTSGVMFGNVIAVFFQGGEYTRGAAAALLVTAMVVLLLVVFRRSLELRGTDATHG